MVEYRQVETSGWFETGGTVPDFQVEMLEGWFDAYTEIIEEVAEAVIDLGLLFMISRR